MDEQIIEIHGAAEIHARINALAADIMKFYGAKEPTVLCSLDNSFIFLADLLRQLNPALPTSFLRINQSARARLQELTFLTPVEVAGREVLLIEGVMDTGVPQAYIKEQLTGAHGAASVKICVLVNKPDNRRVELEPDWRAFESHDQFVFGYGLGFQERWRGLPYLASFAAKTF
jgi:hypoxanthine phosphoribosyltransferase